MNRDISDSASPPPWLVDWMRDASRHGQCHSLVLATTGQADLDRVAAAVAEYLNEFDSDGGCQWRTFDTALLRRLAGNPASRSLVLAGAGPLTTRFPVRPDLDQVARCLAGLGGVVLVGPAGLEATSDLNETFRICLSDGEPADFRSYHMWVNPDRFSFDGLVSVIADSFLNWSCHGEAFLPDSASRSAPAPPERHSGADLPG